MNDVGKFFFNMIKFKIVINLKHVSNVNLFHFIIKKFKIQFI